MSESIHELTPESAAEIKELSAEEAEEITNEGVVVEDEPIISTISESDLEKTKEADEEIIKDVKEDLESAFLTVKEATGESVVEDEPKTEAMPEKKDVAKVETIKETGVESKAETTTPTTEDKEEVVVSGGGSSKLGKLFGPLFGGIKWLFKSFISVPTITTIGTAASILKPKDKIEEINNKMSKK